jgi:hypothetical protein
MTCPSAMRRRFLLILPFLAVLTILFWTSAAGADPGHDPAMHAQPAQTSAPAAVDVVHAAAHETSYHCPARCHGCTAECQMQCAAAVALPAPFELTFSNGRHRPEPLPLAARLDWRAEGPRDPPRPSA